MSDGGFSPFRVFPASLMPRSSYRTFCLCAEYSCWATQWIGCGLFLYYMWGGGERESSWLQVTGTVSSWLWKMSFCAVSLWDDQLKKPLSLFGVSSGAGSFLGFCIYSVTTYIHNQDKPFFHFLFSPIERKHYTVKKRHHSFPKQGRFFWALIINASTNQHCTEQTTYDHFETTTQSPRRQTVLLLSTLTKAAHTINSPYIIAFHNKSPTDREGNLITFRAFC